MIKKELYDRMLYIAWCIESEQYEVGDFGIVSLKEKYKKFLESVGSHEGDCISENCICSRCFLQRCEILDL